MERTFSRKTSSHFPFGIRWRRCVRVSVRSREWKTADYADLHGLIADAASPGSALVSSGCFGGPPKRTFQASFSAKTQTTVNAPRDEVRRSRDAATSTRDERAPL